MMFDAVGLSTILVSKSLFSSKHNRNLLLLGCETRNTPHDPSNHI